MGAGAAQWGYLSLGKFSLSVLGVFSWDGQNLAINDLGLKT